MQHTIQNCHTCVWDA